MKTLFIALAAIFLLQINADARFKRHYRGHRSHRVSHATHNDEMRYRREQAHPVREARHPSAYKGDQVPENDGVKKNKQRNLNYNSGQALPANNGR